MIGFPMAMIPAVLIAVATVMMAAIPVQRFYADKASVWPRNVVP
jgi:hypothetical protein